jgi:hypothetical protein
MLQRGMRAAGQMSSAGCDAAHAGRVCATAGKAARWGDDLRIEGLGREENLEIRGRVEGKLLERALLSVPYRPL